MRTFKIDAPCGPAHWTLMEAGEIPAAITRYRSSGGRNGGLSRCDDSWCGGSLEDLRRFSELGDNRLVEQADKYLSEIEDQVPMSRGWRNVEDVVGAVPNIPAYLAGHPQHMRRRERVARDNAPLTLFLDLTSTAAIDAETVQRRAVVLLALVRMLIEHRPVALWAGIGQDVGRSGAGYVAWRIDTTPLDLARAAYHIGATNMARRFGYGLNGALHDAGGGWPHGDNMHTAMHGERDLRAVFETEMLVIPALISTHQSLRDPVGWLKTVMSKYVQTEEA